MGNLLKRHWPLIGMAILLGVVAFYVLKSGKEMVEGPAEENAVSEGGLKIKDIHYTQSDPEAKVKWVLDAREVTFSEDRNSILFSDFLLSVEPEDRPWFRLKGKKGNYLRDSGDMELRGDLEGTSQNGYRITTELMKINDKKGHMKTDKPVSISGPFFSVRGTGLFVDLEKERLRILSDVTTVVNKESLT